MQKTGSAAEQPLDGLPGASPLSRVRVTGVSVQEQRQIAKAIKNAREMALLPYTSTTR